MVSIASATSTVKRNRSEAASRICRGVAVTATALVVMGFAVGGVAEAGTAGGATFTPSVSCGASFVTFSVHSDRDEGSYAKLWAYDPSTQQWVTDGTWVDATSWSSFQTANISFVPGYYYFYLSYAQWTGTEWSYSGELINSYDQQLGYFEDTASPTCYMNY